MHTLHLFAGAGGGILADKILGHTPVGAVEIEEAPRRMLLARQLDGVLPVFPIWDDVTTFRADNPDCKPAFDAYRAIADDLCICGGFPCQDISPAGKGAGISGARSGLWSEYARIIGEIRPRFAFVENSSALTRLGLHRVLGDLSEMGYDTEWCVLGADDAGAPHQRKRIWILAHTASVERATRGEKRSVSEKGTKDGLKRDHSSRSSEASVYVANAKSTRLEGFGGNSGELEISEPGDDGLQVCDPSSEGLPHGSVVEMGQPGSVEEFKRSDWWTTEPGLGGVADGVADRVDRPRPHRLGAIPRVGNGISYRGARLKAIGNGQCPQTAVMAFTILKQRLGL
jgi:DNA (cytosine-5)-methyltransferase 1